MIKSMLSDKLAFVTGGGSGIGRAVCQLMAKEGARVIVSDVNLVSAENTVSSLKGIVFNFNSTVLPSQEYGYKTTASGMSGWSGPLGKHKFKSFEPTNCSNLLQPSSCGNDHLPIELDVSNTDQVDHAVTEILSRYSAPPTVLVNSAGITRDAFLLKMAPDQFSQVLDINLKGTFAVTQAICQALVTNKKTGSVINIASIVGQIGNMGQCNYAASKAGVEAFTKTVAKEMGVYGIRCNAVVPGFITSPMTDKVPEKVKDMFKAQVPLGRLGTPEEVAEVILFLASDRSSYVNGASIKVSGGL